MQPLSEYRAYDNNNQTILEVFKQNIVHNSLPSSHRPCNLHLPKFEEESEFYVAEFKQKESNKLLQINRVNYKQVPLVLINEFK